MNVLTSLSRRRLLRSAAGSFAAVVAAPVVVSSRALGRDGAAAPSERIALGVIGTGSRCSGVMPAFLHRPECQVVAVCDVQKALRDKAVADVSAHYAAAARAGTYKGCQAHNDFRELLARSDVDAVQITTPDHWHVPIGIAAARAGKDVYGEKPLGAMVAEGRQMVQTVQRHGRVFQHGTQRRSFERVRLGCELVRNGYIGKLQHVEVACDASWAGKVVQSEPVPPGFDYDMWLGPAPYAPYSRARVYRFGWYFISDYCPTGWIAGQGVHYIDLAHWGMNVERTGPVEIEGHGAFPSEGLFDTATRFHIELTYANGLKIIYADKVENPREGVRFVGSEGWVHVQDGLASEPASLAGVSLKPTDVRLNHSRSNVEDFLDCVRSRRETVAPVEIAHRASTVCSLGDIALRLGRKLRWDPAAERFVNDAQADRMLTRAMRSPWAL
ncbi:MAG: Inositol 2-dehydrogenase [Planctomycetes bacterium ADurb.Bin126]|nr:MAG: Inositol 2-dehydrogenase [Planctomycetes bacterium ADurb.Bin126]HOD80146.1 Gfo/Idh/MocA family oxidoreductase [Phycisphaerae bacterium]HQL71619.1 Gfo/Idh/MocA family oxidoreductase [Phycisphaerae bacterium]